MKKSVLFRKMAAGFCAGILIFSAGETAEAKSGKEIPVPAAAESGGVVHSTVYGDVLITTEVDGTKNYTFFSPDTPAVKELMAALNSGQNLDLDRIITESSTNIQKITDSEDHRIENDIVDYGAAAANKGSYSYGSVYGPNLSENDFAQLQAAVSNFMITQNVAAMSDIKKVRAAHDYLVKNCAPAQNGTKFGRDTAWGALVKGEANSKGYARAMKALCDAMGVGSCVITSNNSSSLKDYMWNTVLIDGQWYIVDVFCDDSNSCYATYLISDDSYYALGMRWNTGDSVPVCKLDYRK